MPRISVPGLFDPVFPAARPIADDSDLISPKAIRLRLLALKEALDHLPRHAMRLARWRARRGLKTISRTSPFRPGSAPGYPRTSPREIDAILSDCHYFAREAWAKPDRSRGFCTIGEFSAGSAGRALARLWFGAARASLPPCGEGGRGADGWGW
jgi:hypothetical protein